MSDMVLQRNVAQLVTTRLGSAFTSVTAGGAGDNTAILGTAIQRSLIGLPSTVALALLFTGTLAATKTLSFLNCKIQHSDDGTTWTDFLLFTDPGIVASATGANAGQLQLGASLNGAKDYVRVVYTPDLSNTVTDTATVAAALVFAGARALPSI